MEERRKFQRVQLKNVVLKCSFKNKEPIQVSLKDVSGGGGKFVTKELLNEGEKIKFYFYFKNTTSNICIGGRIVWSIKKGNQYIYGAKFEKVPEKFMYILAETILHGFL